MTTKQETWQVLKAQGGDREALDALLRGVQRPLYLYLQRLCGDPDVAQDVLQEAFLRICRGLSWLHDPALFRPWAYRIASREAMRKLRHERRWKQSLTGDETLEAIVADPPNELPAWREDLEQMLEHVSPASRAVLVLHYLEGLSLEEVAAVLGIAVGTVKSRLAYGLRRLREASGRKDA